MAEAPTKDAPKPEPDLAASVTAYEFDKDRDVRHETVPPRSAQQIIEAASEGKLLADQEVEQQDALDWLLAAFDSPAEAQESLHTMSLNVGGLGPNAKWIKWTVRNVDGALLRRLREQAMGGSRRTQAGVDLNAVYQSNVQVILEGTIYPPIREAASQRGVANPGVLIEEAFKTKPGLIEAIAGTIMDLSGYDPDASRDEREVAAAGNS